MHLLDSAVPPGKHMVIRIVGIVSFVVYVSVGGLESKNHTFGKEKVVRGWVGEWMEVSA